MLEARVASVLGLSVRLAGDPLHLLTGDQVQRLRVQIATMGFDEHLYDEQLSGPLKPDQLRELIGRGREDGELQAQAKLDLILMQDAELVDLSRAQCSYKADEDRIRKTIQGEQKAIISLIAGLIRDHVCDIHVDKIEVVPGPLACFSSLDAAGYDGSGTDLSGTRPRSLLQFATWLRLQRQVRAVQQLTLRDCCVGKAVLDLIERAAADGALARLAILDVRDNAYVTAGVADRLRSHLPGVELRAGSGESGLSAPAMQGPTVGGPSFPIAGAGTGIELRARSKSPTGPSRLRPLPSKLKPKPKPKLSSPMLDAEASGQSSHALAEMPADARIHSPREEAKELPVCVKICVSGSFKNFNSRPVKKAIAGLFEEDSA